MTDANRTVESNVHHGFDMMRFVEMALTEDLGGTPDPARDITAAACFADTAQLRAQLVSRGRIVVAGIGVADAFFHYLDPACTSDMHVNDGDLVTDGTALMTISGSARALLAAERSALNSLQHLCGIATLTRRYVDAIAGTGATLLDTRKTLPGLRHLEKYAVRMGGAENHRMGLYDAPMVKDNHIAAAGSVEGAVRACKAAGLRNITVEVDSVAQIDAALAAGADRILLDNMGLEALRSAVAKVGGRVPLEASGGVRLETIRVIAETGVDYVSVGRITQSAPAADIGLDYLAD